MEKSPFICPARVTQEWGENAVSYYREIGMLGHNGIDLVPVKPAWGVHAIWPGIVVHDVDAPVTSTHSWGNTLAIYHPSIKAVVRYAHLSENTAQINDEVRAGALIGIMGSTGNSTGAHLHMGFYPCDENVQLTTSLENGYRGAVDPMNYLTL